MGLLALLVPFVEIVLMTVVINYLLSFFWNTRTRDLILGFLAFLVIFYVTRMLNLAVLERLMDYVVNVLPLAVLIIFQPEIRITLSKLSTIRKNNRQEISDFDRFLEGISSSVYRLAIKQIGALIIIENEDSLIEYCNKSVILNAEFSSELLESIFMTSTPLHDGAVVISNTKIVSAATILPLADDTSQLVRSMGTRHRACLGVSQLTDAFVIVVSEETGKVSVARDGIITRGVKIDRLKGIMRSIFHPTPLPTKKRFHILEFFKPLIKLFND